MRLAELARAHGRPAYLVDSVHELPPGCLDGCATVLVTAGASAPEEVVEECVAHLRGHYGATIENRTVREEHVSFPLPRELRVLPAGT
jgi:4-hydroxy-3-methylbut-2-enyl diphosphate reductase